MPNINIKIRNKVAKGEYAVIVCDNSDYTAVFDFDAEWDEYTTKTARFVYCGTYTDVVFTGNSCPIPEIHDTRSLTVGVYAGDLHTTTPAYISCVPSILFGNGVPADPTPDVYAQIMELLNKESGIWYPAVDDAGNMSWTRSMSETEPQPVNIKGPKGDAGADGVGIPGADGKDGISPTVSVAAITGGNRVTITDAEGAKTFDVMDGARGASGADGKDYVLTDADKQEIAETAAGLVDVPSVQPDWNQNDSTQPDYVKNRPFYTGDPVETVLVEESTVSFAEQGGMYAAAFPSTTFEATVGETYKVYWDGTGYECVCVDFNGNTVIGNLSVPGAGSDTGEPFFMGVYNGHGIQIYTADTSASHTFSICVFAPEVVKIATKYLPFDIAQYKAPIVISKKIQNMSDSEKEQINYAFKSGSLILYAYDPDKIGICGVITHFYFDKSSSLLKFTYFIGNQINYYDSSVDQSGATAVELSYDGIQRIGEFAAKNILQKNPLKYFVLNSSTENSTKKFRITVDDSGAITATEVS